MPRIGRRRWRALSGDARKHLAPSLQKENTKEIHINKAPRPALVCTVPPASIGPSSTLDQNESERNRESGRAGEGKKEKENEKESKKERGSARENCVVRLCGSETRKRAPEHHTKRARKQKTPQRPHHI